MKIGCSIRVIIGFSRFSFFFNIAGYNSTLPDLENARGMLPAFTTITLLKGTFTTLKYNIADQTFSMFHLLIFLYFIQIGRQYVVQ